MRHRRRATIHVPASRVHVHVHVYVYVSYVCDVCACVHMTVAVSTAALGLVSASAVDDNRDGAVKILDSGAP